MGPTGLLRTHFYTLSPDARKQLHTEMDAFRRMTKVIEQVLEPEG